MTIKTLQTRLTQAGFSCVVDGHLGPMTLAAYMGFLAGRKPDAAITERAAALSAHWPMFHERSNPQGWTKLRLAHFLAQVCHETGGWRTFEENLHYATPARLNKMFSAVTSDAHAAALIAKGSKAIANCVYANRLGNGSEGSGDGWRYRGQGDIQITGADNYSIHGNAIGLNIHAHPEIVQQPDVSIRVALSYWRLNMINAAADQNNAARVTLLINGKAMEGLAQRKGLTEKALSVWV